MDSALLKLLSKMNMPQATEDVYAAMGKQAPAELALRAKTILAQLASLRECSGSILAVLEDSELYERLREARQFTMEYLSSHHGVTLDALDSLYEYIRLKYDCGDYEVAVDMLPIVRQLSTDPARCLATMWGQLAAGIMFEAAKPATEANWESVKETLRELREAVDSHSFASHAEQLMQRAWLIHWALFVFTSYDGGRNGIIDLFFQDHYINTIQTACPHVLRYLTAAVITNKRRRTVLKDLVRVLQQERASYHDPITEFVECLYVNFDFDRAQEKLRACDALLASDPFLCSSHAEFMENARLFIFETYCRIHQCIDLTMLASKLSMPRDEAERWIVNLIHNARLDAKIDSQSDQVVMQEKHPSMYVCPCACASPLCLSLSLSCIPLGFFLLFVGLATHRRLRVSGARSYQQIIDSTKGLTIRTHVLNNHCSRLEERE